MVTAQLGPAGSDYAQAPQILPLTVSAPTPSSGVVWWRLDVPAGPNALMVYLDVSSYSTGWDTDNTRLDANVWRADGLVTTPPPFSSLEQWTAFSFNTYETLPPGRSYFIGVGTHLYDTTIPAPDVTYRLLVSDFGSDEVVQLSDVTAVWAYDGRSLEPWESPGTQWPGRTSERPTDARYVLGYQDIESTGPGYGAEMNFQGTYGDNDPGAATEPLHNDSAPTMHLAYAAAADFTAQMNYGIGSSLHMWTIGGTDPDSGAREMPSVPEVVVVSDGAGRWDEVGYHAGAQHEEFLGPGHYGFGLTAVSRVVQVSAFTQITGPLGYSPTTLQSLVQSHQAINAQTVGDATLVSLEMKPDFIDHGGYPEEDVDGTVDPALRTSWTCPTDWIDWSARWREKFVTNLNPITEADATSLPKKWGPNQSVQHWEMHEGQPVLVDGADPDIYGNDRNGSHWFGCNGLGCTMPGAPQIRQDEWTPVNVAEALTFEAANPDKTSVCVAVLPTPLHEVMDPSGVGGFITKQDGPFDSSIKAYQPVLVLRTVIRPAPVRLSYRPEIPDVPAIPTISPLLNAEITGYDSRFQRAVY